VTTLGEDDPQGLLADEEVSAAIEHLERDPEVRSTVPHPDDDREFYPPDG
jgi:hypothetical protein